MECWTLKLRVAEHGWSPGNASSAIFQTGEAILHPRHSATTILVDTLL
jgi:hypothetical protein